MVETIKYKSTEKANGLTIIFRPLYIYLSHRRPCVMYYVLLFSIFNLIRTSSIICILSTCNFYVIFLRFSYIHHTFIPFSRHTLFFTYIHIHIHQTRSFVTSYFWPTCIRLSPVESTACPPWAFPTHTFVWAYYCVVISLNHHWFCLVLFGKFT